MRATVLDPGPFTRVGIIRRWWHLHVLHHTVAASVVRAFSKREGFYFRRGWVCVHCKKTWP